MIAPENHGKTKTVLIPLIIASVIIIIILAMGMDNQTYAIPVDSFDFMQQEDNVMVRLDGFASEITSRDDGRRFFKLCSKTKCIPMEVPREVGTIFKPSDDLVVTGITKNNTIHVTQILRRCHGQEP